jgi:hypothetical protein
MINKELVIKILPSCSAFSAFLTHAWLTEVVEPTKIFSLYELIVFPVLLIIIAVIFQKIARNHKVEYLLVYLLENLALGLGAGFSIKSFVILVRWH